MNDTVLIKFIGFEYKRAGDMTLLTFLNFPIYEKVGSNFHIPFLILYRRT